MVLTFVPRSHLLQSIYFIFMLVVLCNNINCIKNKESKAQPYRLTPVVRRIINTTNAPDAIGPYSQAVQIDNKLYVSGEIGIDPKTGVLVPGGIKAQTEQAITNIFYILQEAGVGLSNIIKTTVLLQNITDFNDMNSVYETFFKQKYPARATFQVAALPKSAIVEIEAEAIIGDIIDV